MIKQKILIVDDEKSNLDILYELLKKDYTTIFAKSGTQAVERAITQSPDIILLDINMPEITGFDTMKIIKNNNRTKDIPVIFLAESSGNSTEEQGLLLGAVDYIYKPFNAAVAKIKIHNHLQLLNKMKILEKIALLDGLTEIPNRRSFSERYNLEINRAYRNKVTLSLAIIDIDSFKQYNDNYGHFMGDVVLKMIASTIKTSLKRATDFTARIGGEEFILLLPDTPSEGAIQLAQDICSEIEALQIEHSYSKVSNYLTVSIGGITFVPASKNQNDEYFKLADLQLYTAKNKGKNQVSWKIL